MPSANQLNKYAQAALASYATNFVADGTNNISRYSPQKVGMSAAQASQFEENWNVVQQATANNGFAAVLLQNRSTSEKVLAIAGTDESSPKDWLTDVVNVAVLGTVVGMPQYLMRRGVVNNRGCCA